MSILEVSNVLKTGPPGLSAGIGGMNLKIAGKFLVRKARQTPRNGIFYLAIGEPEFSFPAGPVYRPGVSTIRRPWFLPG